MATRYSTGMKNALLDQFGLKELLEAQPYVIKFFAGTVPTGPDDSIGSATLLVTIGPNNGDGSIAMAFDPPSNGVLVKSAAQAWSGVIATTGDVTFFRLCTPTDTNGASTTAIRMQGTVGTVGTDIIVANTSLVSGNTQTINQFATTIPNL